MKKIILFLLALLMFTSVDAQKIKIKKDIIYLDKDPIGRVDGSLWKTNSDEAKIYGLNDELILTIMPKDYTFNNPLYSDIRWYNIKFGDTGKEFMLKVNNLTSSVKYVLKGLDEDYGININGKLIQNQDEIISKNNYHDQFVLDTTKIRNEEAKYMGILANNEILRDRKKMVTFISNDKGEYNIVQDNTIIGTFYKEDEINKQNGAIVNTTYWFKESFYEPQGDEKLKEYFAATTKINCTDKSCEVFTFVDKKIHKVQISDPAKAEKQILKMLLEKNYL